MVIKSFADKKLAKFFETGSKVGIQPHHSDKVARILDRLDAAVEIKDMDYPGSGLHQLYGKLKDYWAVKVNGNYRIWFKFRDENAFDVEYGDYH